jgi:poly(3-hydroxybutyrate) depolymerase
MPIFAIGGTRDVIGETQVVGGCARLGYLEWLYADNLLRPSPYQALPAGSCTMLPPQGIAQAEHTVNFWACYETYGTDPYSTRNGQVPDGYKWTEQVARGPGGCEIGENWIVHGMNHYWSGGSTDPQYTNPTSPSPTSPQGFNDPKGPSASQLSWDFFKQFTLKGGNTTCSPG